MKGWKRPKASRRLQRMRLTRVIRVLRLMRTGMRICMMRRLRMMWTMTGMMRA